MSWAFWGIVFSISIASSTDISILLQSSDDANAHHVDTTQKQHEAILEGFKFGGCVVQAVAVHNGPNHEDDDYNGTDSVFIHTVNVAQGWDLSIVGRRILFPHIVPLVERGDEATEQHGHVLVLILLHPEEGSDLEPDDDKDKEEAHRNEEQAKEQFVMQGPVVRGVGIRFRMKILMQIVPESFFMRIPFGQAILKFFDDVVQFGVSAVPFNCLHTVNVAHFGCLSTAMSTHCSP